jgi:hypothetical protein
MTKILSDSTPEAEREILSGKFSDEHCSWLCSTFSLKDAQFSSSKLVLLKTGTHGPLLCKKKLML